MKHRLTLAIAALAVAASSYANDGPPAVQSPARGNEWLLQQHLKSFVDNELEAIVAGYSNDAVLVTADATYSGPQQIRGFFANLMRQFPKGASTLVLDRTRFDRDLIYFTWHAKTPTLDVPFATDTIIVSSGKIVRQTFAGDLRPAKR